MESSPAGSSGSSSVVDFDQALQTVLAHAAQAHAARLGKPTSEALPLLDCVGRVLAAAVTADRDQPPFDRSTRDGFAVRAEDAASTGLHLAGMLRAGDQ